MPNFVQWLLVTKSKNYFKFMLGFWVLLSIYWAFYVPPTLIEYRYDRFPAENIYCNQVKDGKVLRFYLHFRSARSKEYFMLSPHSLEMCQYLIDRMLEGSSVEVTYSTVDINEVIWVSRLKVNDTTYFDEMRKFNMCDYIPARKCIPN